MLFRVIAIAPLKIEKKFDSYESNPTEKYFLQVLLLSDYIASKDAVLSQNSQLQSLRKSRWGFCDCWLASQKCPNYKVVLQ